METQLKINQSYIAELVGVTESSVSLWINGLRKPTIGNAVKLSILTGSQPELWLEGDTKQIKEFLNQVIMESDVKKKFRTGKIKQSYVAEQVGVSPVFISQILKGKKSPSWKLAKKLYELTGIKPDLWMESKTNNSELNKNFTEYQYNEPKGE